MNRIRSIWRVSYLLIGVAMILVIGCSSEQDDIDNYRDRIGPPYEDVREIQDEFENSLRQTVNLNTVESSAIDSMEIVAALASKYQTSAGILISVLGSEKPPDRCATYNSILVDLMKAYSSSVDLVIEEMDSVSSGVTDSLLDREFQSFSLGEEIDQLISDIPVAEIDCFVIE